MKATASIQYKQSQILNDKQIETLNVLESTQLIIKEAVQKLGYHEDMYQLLKEPARFLTVRIPVRIDDSFIKVFTGYRAQHNDAVGPP